MTAHERVPKRWDIDLANLELSGSYEPGNGHRYYGAGSKYDFDLADTDLDRRFAAFALAAIDDASRRWFDYQ